MKLSRRPHVLALLLLTILPACRISRREAPAPEATPRPKAGVVVKLSYGSEKKAWLTESIATFETTRPRTASGKVISIDAVAEGSAESMEAILAGQSDVHVWSPASSLLVDVLNDRWVEGHGGLGTARPIVGEAPSLVLSPVVIAFWEPMARALGWPDKPIGWGDVVKLATEEGGWSGYGKPQWGDFKLGHTHPRFSNSGALALVAATYAGAGKGRDLTEADVAKASGFVKRFESKVVHYGRSTGFFAEKMFTRGPGYLSAAVLYENLVAESYTNEAYASRPMPVVAVYPKEGTFWADHPYAILDLPSVTPEVREAAELFRKFLLSPETQRRALSAHGFRPSDPSVSLGAPIDAAHGLDPTMPKNLLPNPKVSVTRVILDRFEAVKRPVAITFVLDTSGSMKGEPLRQAKEGARVFLDSLPPTDQVRVLLFSSKPVWVSQAMQPLSIAKPALVTAIDEAFANGGTALYQAIREACATAGESKETLRAVVVLTDGMDTDSRGKKEDLIALLAQGRGEEDTPSGPAPPRVFTIAYGSDADPAVLKEIAEAGGGAFFAGTPKNIRSVYAELASFF